VILIEKKKASAACAKLAAELPFQNFSERSLGHCAGRLQSWKSWLQLRSSLQSW